MKYNLRDIRKKYGFSMQEMGNFLGMMPNYYSKYEEEGEIPSKYIYRLWLKIKDFPIPEDFFCYTSFTLVTNMKYHRLTQKQVADMFHISSQSTISSLFSENRPMYELKEYFHQFNPLIIPIQALDMDSQGNILDNCKFIQNLSEKGNFISAERKKRTRELKQKIKQA